MAGPPVGPSDSAHLGTKRPPRGGVGRGHGSERRVAAAAMGVAGQSNADGRAREVDVREWHVAEVWQRHPFW